LQTTELTPTKKESLGKTLAVCRTGGETKKTALGGDNPTAILRFEKLGW
jgi:hypothetical protein